MNNGKLYKINVGCMSCTLHRGALKTLKKMGNKKRENGQKMDNLIKQEMGCPGNEVKQTIIILLLYYVLCELK